MPEAERLSEPSGDLHRRLMASLSELEQQGGREFDAPGLALIESLLASSRELGGEAGRRLEVRAQARLEALSGAFAEARTRAGQQLERLVQLGVDDDGALARALDVGDLARITRCARRHRRREEPPTAPRKSQRAAAARDLYRDSLADLSTTLSAASDFEMKGEHAGQLNGRVLSARILEAAEKLSPAYRRSLVTTLIELAPLLRLPALPLPRKRG